MAVFCLVALSSQTKDKVGGYQRLTPKQVLNSPNAKGALEFGADAIISKLIADRKIPKDHYKIIEILYAARQVVAGTNYKFEVVIASDKYKIHAEYVVFRSFKGKYSLTSSDYKIKKEDDKKKDDKKKDDYKKKDDKKKDDYKKKDDKKKDDYKKKDDKKKHDKDDDC